MSGKLTKAQIVELERLRDYHLSPSLARQGWPGFPQRMLDGRCVAALAKHGYIEGGIHTFRLRHDTEECQGIWWRITPAGRAALSKDEGATG